MFLINIYFVVDMSIIYINIDIVNNDKRTKGDKMQLHTLQKRKKYLVKLCKDASQETFMAQQQDCYGMADTIRSLSQEESFLSRWLGEVQSQIDDLNKGEVK
jgi:hypothetical protein